MVLGLRSKNRKGTSVQVDYLIHVQEIKPWPSLQSLHSAQSVLLHWENGDQSSGSFPSSVGDGKVEFSKSFRLPVTLYGEASRKGTAHDSFQKNCLEFNLCEPRKDKANKSQLLGSAVINLADYGIIKDKITISTPINLKKTFRSTMQPILCVDIQPFDNNSSMLKEFLLEKSGSESVSGVTTEGNDEESEIASFTDDDDDDVSTHSSHTVSSVALESVRGSPGQYDKIGPGSVNSGTRRLNGEPTLPSGIASSKPGVNSAAGAFKHLNGASTAPSSTNSSSCLQNPVNDPAARVVLSDNYILARKNSNYVGIEGSQTNQEADGKAWRHEKSGLEGAAISSLHVDLMEDRENKEQQDIRQDGELLEVNKHALPETLVGKLPQEAVQKQVKLSNTLSFNMTGIPVQANARRDKLKHLKSVQLQFDSAENDGPFISSQLMEKAKKIDIPENIHKRGMSYSPNEGEYTTSSFSEDKVKSKSKVEILEEEFGEAAKTVVGLCSVVAENWNSTHKLQLMEKAKEIDLTESVYGGGETDAVTQREEAKSSFSGDRVLLESKVEMLEEELTEAAALEVGLYSVVAEHGVSTSKVHAPARRLSRFYLHACKARSQAKRASAARAIASGLILVSKACGNDVPRLAFWLSNSIVLRAIVSQAVEKLQPAGAPFINSNGGQKGWSETSPYKEERNNNKGCSDEWEEPQTCIAALEKVEAWIFSRIVKSVWWQTLTPHMQSSAVKGSSSKKTYSRRFGFGDQEQGNFAIDLWKKAFKDACERLCPVRAGGHECGCLPVLARLVMEQLVGRLDVAMFNAILRESAEEMPTDPVSDPISDPKVLPIPAGKSSFGAGAQLKNAVGNWSRWLTDLFGIDDSDALEEIYELDGSRLEYETSFKAFHLLNALSDLMMLPFELLADRSSRKEVCPTFGAQLIKRVLNNYVPDEFNPAPIPEAILEALDSEDLAEAGEESITSFPCTATPTVYLPPSAASLANIIGEVGNHTLRTSGSAVLRKSYTSDDELDELDSPMTSIIVDNSGPFPASTPPGWTHGKMGRKVVRYQLLREVWKDGE